jgi:hypothetical protein
MSCRVFAEGSRLTKLPVRRCFAAAVCELVASAGTVRGHHQIKYCALQLRWRRVLAAAFVALLNARPALLCVVSVLQACCSIAEVCERSHRSKFTLPERVFSCICVYPPFVATHVQSIAETTLLLSGTVSTGALLADDVRTSQLSEKRMPCCTIPLVYSRSSGTRSS